MLVEHSILAGHGKSEGHVEISSPTLHCCYDCPHTRLSFVVSREARHFALLVWLSVFFMSSRFVHCDNMAEIWLVGKGMIECK